MRKLGRSLKVTICNSGIWDTSVPGISFDQKGNSNYSKIFNEMLKLYPRGKSGQLQWEKFLSKIKKEGKGKKYDCIIGVSGGTDSSYLMYVMKEIYKLRPLAVTFDNGWSSEISVRNIKKVTDSLDIDLETYVVNYEEMKDILLSYMKASLPWIDFPTDHAIKSTLYRVAKSENIGYILIGHDFRSEGSQPLEWTYSDSYQLDYINKKFGTRKLTSFPNMGMLEFLYLSQIKKIKMLYPFFYLNYNKQDAQSFLKKKFNWQYYGGHHHENSFTKFSIAFWMKKKFNIDKRIITLSAQVISGKVSREEALKQISILPYSESRYDNEINFIIDKLGISIEEYNSILNLENKDFRSYPSYYPLIKLFKKPIFTLQKLLFSQTPTSLLQDKYRSD